MKALSVMQPWASMIASGEKWCEVRTWGTDYRGDLLIYASRNVRSMKYSELPRGVAVCVVKLTSIAQLHRSATSIAGSCLSAEQIYSMSSRPFRKCWILANPRPVRRVSLRGALYLFDVPDEKIIYV